MTIIERVIFNDVLLALIRLPAFPYNWVMRARMRFIAHGDCLATPEENENRWP